jgi:hypothetical protein
MNHIPFFFFFYLTYIGSHKLVIGNITRTVYELIKKVFSESKLLKILARIKMKALLICQSFISQALENFLEKKKKEKKKKKQQQTNKRGIKAFI